MMSPMSLTLSVNGQAHELPSGALLPDLLTDLGVSCTQVALEINGELLPRAQWETHPLASGDKIELVTLVGGG